MNEKNLTNAFPALCEQLKEEGLNPADWQLTPLVDTSNDGHGILIISKPDADGTRQVIHVGVDVGPDGTYYVPLKVIGIEDSDVILDYAENFMDTLDYAGDFTDFIDGKGGDV